jgi:hypothetical protein
MFAPAIKYWANIAELANVDPEEHPQSMRDRPCQGGLA